MILNLQEYREKVLGCWMGKNIGGTLGAPVEWHRRINHINFYLQELEGNPVPNDDLDLQLMWLIALEEKGVDINARTLGDYWMLYVTPHWAEYGAAKTNMKAGLVPPLSGTTNNPFKDSCGSYIRSEIWACITPGCPEKAVMYSYEDAIIDHGNGEGVYAEVFCAALESAAFLEKNIHKLIDIGLSYIPENSDVAKAVKLVRELYKSGKTWLEARDAIIRNFYSGFHFSVSEEDEKKGFGEGKVGWEVPSNIAIVILGLLYGEGDFDKSLCVTVNCGEDTDCTAATVGSILGIIQGIHALPEKWTKPIGGNIKTACLNLGELEGKVPFNIEDLTNRVEKIAQQVILRYDLPVQLSNDRKSDSTDMKPDYLYANNNVKGIYEHSNGPVYKFDFFDVYVDYGIDGAVIKENMPKKIILHLKNTYKTPEILNIQWYTPEYWEVLPAKHTLVYMQHDYSNMMPTDFFHGRKKVEFEIKTEKITEGINRFVVVLTVQGRATAMHVPVVLLNEIN